MSGNEVLPEYLVRPLDSGWREICHRLDGDPSAAIHASDPIVMAGVRYGRALQQCVNDTQRRRIGARWPDIKGACAIGSTSRSAMRARLELRILADEPLEQIAHKTGIATSVISAFERLFFDVRGRLEAVDFIMAHVVQRAPLAWQPIQILSYLGGPHVVDLLLGVTPPGPRPGNAHEARAYLAADIELSSARMGALSLRLQDPNNSRLIAQLINHCRETAAENESNFVRFPSENVKSMLAGLNFRVGRSTNEETSNGLQEYEGCAAELRADEMMDLVFGAARPDLHEIKSLQLPPRRAPSPDPGGPARGPQP